jgi:hypothetical protein
MKSLPLCIDMAHIISINIHRDRHLATNYRNGLYTEVKVIQRYEKIFSIQRMLSICQRFLAIDFYVTIV